MGTNDLTIDTDEIRVEKQLNGKFRQYIRRHNTDTLYTTGKEYEGQKEAKIYTKTTQEIGRII